MLVELQERRARRAEDEFAHDVLGRSLLRSRRCRLSLVLRYA